MNKKSGPAILFVSSMLIFGTIGIFRKFIPLSSGMLAMLRGFTGALVIALFVKIRGGKLFHGIGTRNFLLIALTGGIIGFNWILLFEAYNCTTVSRATLCYYMEPTIVILLSPLFFKEKLTAGKLLCALAAVIGMVFVSGILEDKGISADDMKGVLFGLGAGALYASVVILNKLIHIEDVCEKTVIQLFSAAVILLPYLLLTGGIESVPCDTWAIVMLAVVCIIHTGLAYTMYFAGMKGMKGQTVALLSYIDPVSAMVFSALILGERMSPLGILGAVLIIGAALVAGE